MIGIVLVSHSRALADALVDLVRQVSTADVSIAIAAGVGDDRLEFGTDAIELMEAIQSVYTEDGVLVLMDLGSAVLSAKMALDLLPQEIAEKVLLCPAPFVEGAIAAAVQAGVGSDLGTVNREARTALLPKDEQLGEEATIIAGIGVGSTALAGSEYIGENQDKPVSIPIEKTGESIQLTIRNLHGLHARPAARFVKTAASFQSDIQVRNLTNGKGPVTAKSLNALATLGAVKDHDIIISASGPDSSTALQTLAKMVEEGFGEIQETGRESAAIVASPDRPIPPASGVEPAISEAGELHAIPVSEGVAFGPFFRYQPPLPPISTERISNPQTAWTELQLALESTEKAIRQRRVQLTPTLGEEQAAIFDAHELILQDPDLLAKTYRLIFDNEMNPAAAWMQVIQETADSYKALDDSYLKQRAIDVLDVGRQVLFALAGKTEGIRLELKEPVILFAEELTPTETSALDMGKVLGLMTTGGGPTSHSAILARALGIPAVSGVSQIFTKLENGTTIGLDGFEGAIWVNPQEERLSDLSRRRNRWLEERQRLLRSSHELATTRDGQRIEVVANVGSVQDSIGAADNGAEGIGLLRTEFLFLTRTTPPTEEEQYRVLCQIGEALTQEGRYDWPIIVRTLDVGGDKELPYIQLAPEANPFLGVRALRLSLRKPELFSPQLRAILRAGFGYHFRIMFPMVANLDEILQARQCIEQAHRELDQEGIPHRWPIEMGIMVEIPSAAILSPILAPHVEFFSIGTNDLTQYTLAAERGNPLLSGLADALHPAVLSLIGEVAQASHKYGKFTGVCGELAGDPFAVPVLVGLGVDELSMNPSAIPRVKSVLRAVDLKETQALADLVLAASGAPEARGIAKDFYNRKVLPLIS